MDLSDLLLFVRAIFKEVWINKFKVIFGGSIVAFAVLLAGMLYPTAYETSTTMYADNQNILKPLLEKSAQTSKVQDQVRIVRDVMLSPRMLIKVIESIMPEFRTLPPADQETELNKVRGNLKISSLGKSYIKVEYTDNSANSTYTTINALTDLFIKDASETQRAESKEAFQFVDNQVKQYKNQLVTAEDNLKAFRAENTDGTASAVDGRITKLKSSIEELTLGRDEQRIRIDSLTQQLSEESRFSAKTYRADVYRQRLAQLNAQRDSLLLNYKEEYPDVVSVTLQIEDMEKAILMAADNDALKIADDAEGGNANPLYIELRSKLAESKIGLFATQRRLDASIRLVGEEQSRRKRIAGKNAELSELTRDYRVTMKIYEDMLERKEKARMSMTLSIEGQGVTYKIQEPAQYPLAPIGLMFRHFVIAGMVLGALIPIAVIGLYIIIDPRLRFISQLGEMTSVPVLAQVPHTLTPFSNRIFRSDMIMMAFISVVVVATYVGLAVLHRNDGLPF